MTLVDTSIWVEHLRAGSPKLVRLLQDGMVVRHLFVIGELACGNLRNRKQLLADLLALPAAAEATSEEVMELVDRHKLYGLGIGWIDAHLIASARLSGCTLWTRDQRLRRAAVAAQVELRP